MSRDESLFEKIRRYRDQFYRIFSRKERLMWSGPGRGNEDYANNIELPLTSPKHVKANEKMNLFNPGAKPDNWDSECKPLVKRVNRINRRNHAFLNKKSYMVNTRQ